MNASALTNLLSQILSSVTAVAGAGSQPGTTSLAGWLANQFTSNHTMVTTVNGLLDEVLVSSGNSAAVQALATQILGVPNLPIKVVGLVNALPTATTLKDLQSSINAIRQEISV